MKRENMLSRLAFITDAQEVLVRAARDFVKAEQEGHCSRIDHARRELYRAGVKSGLAIKRYLGGRGE